MNWADLRLRLRALVFRRRVEQEMDEELQFHLDMHARKSAAVGMSAAESRRKARLEFGGLEQVREECRDRRGVASLESIAQDVRYALRGFRRAPGFVTTVVATIAFALGLNTAAFTLFNAYVLQPLPIRDPHRLFTLAEPGGADRRISLAEFQDLERQTAAFSELAGTDVVLTRGDGHMLLGNLVTARYFTMLGITPAMGRTLAPEDEDKVVLSFAAWRNKYASDAAIVGKQVLIRGVPLMVAGIMPREFTGLMGVPLDFWAPIAVAPRLKDAPAQIRVTGRLKPGWSARQAEAELTAWMQHRPRERRDSEEPKTAVLESQSASLPLSPALIAAFSPIVAVFALVLLVACANVANMMLARAMARQREMGVRLAIGAGRGRLARQVLTESALLAVLAAAAGFAVSQAIIEAALRLVLATMPRGYMDFVTLAPHAPDWRVFGFTLAAAVGATLVFGLAPALQASRANVMQAAAGEFAANLRPSRLRNALVIGQVTASALFVICAVLLLRANQWFEKLDTGLRTHGVIEIELQDRVRAKVLSRLAADPAVERIAGASKIPMAGVLPWMVVAPEGQSNLFGAGYLYASPDYFPLFSVPVEEGRSFTEEEARGPAAVAVISRHTAEAFWPGQTALGRTFRIRPDLGSRRQLAQIGAPLPGFTQVRVIGIARDAVNGWVGNGGIDSTCIYLPRARGADANLLLVRVRGDAERERQRLDAALASSLPGGLDQIHTMDEVVEMQLYPWRMVYWISRTLAALALLLTLSGMYGVLSYLVAQRRKEIGIRVALGASPAGVAAMILRQSLRLALTGVAIGSAGAFGLLRLLASQIDMRMIRSFDVSAFGAGLVVVLAGVAVAAWFPVRRAAGIEPVSTLRCD